MPKNSATEATPLLQDSSASKAHEKVYERFSTSQKRAIVGIVSLCGLMPLFISGSFIPSIAQIAKDLETTGGTVSLAVSISIFATSIGSLIGSSYSGYYGRRPVYCYLLPISVVGSVGVAVAASIPQLLFWRFFQAFGVSSGLSVGAGVIGDIYNLEERGTAIGIFFAAVLLGPALAPLAGGAAAHYASWRAMQLILAIAVLLVFISVLLILPETSHPGTRGVDKREVPVSSRNSLKLTMPVILNPFKPLLLLRSPNVLIVATAVFLTLAVDYVLLIPMAYTIGRKYNLTNEAFVGACFIPHGVGNMIGAPLAGRISDRIVAQYKLKRGSWYPEDRLRAALLPALILVPLSVLGSGILTAYVDGPIGLIDMVLSPCSAYAVDILHSKSAEVSAANSAFRAVLLAFWIMAILPLVENYGVLAADSVAALLGLFAFGLLWAAISYGETLRSLVDLDYSKEENN
ncbi:hypothetical protein EST38_g10836 [Candolleomyces aberdarensis]|uniref:Major facilitator superfamily (MFS) profile domain-containing protein n=1 Tax=Candolleomyces aberdarensis TaxID=2316362 RepID=A0A4Q2D6E5_9AGAR|nr:hypothetical protein EST38_g10836 [Candolleomyces aberdarensis]